MAKEPAKHRTPWTKADDTELRKLAAANTPTRLIAMNLERTVEATRNRAAELGISLKPTNQSPYGKARRS